jgi:hypothetical protein
MSHGNPHQNIDTSLRITGEPWMRRASTRLLKDTPMVDVVGGGGHEPAPGALVLGVLTDDPTTLI